MPRGGYQQPKKPKGVSGPGKKSARTDGKAQPIRSEKVSDRSDLQYGDRKAIEQSQKAAPLGTSSVPRPRQTSSPLQAGAGGGQSPAVPSALWARPDTNPEEPTTTGLDMGPGDGSEALNYQPPALDDREEILQALYDTFPNEDTFKHLNDYRQERSGGGRLPGPAGVPAVQGAPAGSAAPLEPSPVVDETGGPGFDSDTDSPDYLGGEADLEAEA